MGGYLADGQSLTLEERDFLQSNLPAKPAALDIDILYVLIVFSRFQTEMDKMKPLWNDFIRPSVTHHWN